MINRIVIFGDDIGIPQLVKYIPEEKINAAVIASIREKECKSMYQFATYFDFPVLVQPEKGNYTKFMYKIRSLKPDLILCNSYSMKIPSDILDIPTHGAINIHFALLPRYRGANPIQWAIINGETETGVTIHYMTDVIDGGDIIAQKPIQIEFTDTWIDVRDKCIIATDELLQVEIQKILSCTNSRTPQDESLATTFRRRTKDDGEFSWKEPPIDIYNKIRALVKPHPGAFYYDWGGRKVVIDEYVSFASIVSKRKYLWGDE